MTAIYAFVAQLAHYIIVALARVHPKWRLFVQGHRQSWGLLQSLDPEGRPVVWVHVASLGEYQQAVPVLKGLRALQSRPFLLVTFFSPSGFEVVKDKVEADATCYLPLDTVAHARRFVHLLRPTIALFVKYELWPNYLRALSDQGVKHFLIAARFYPKQRLFQFAFGRKLLDSFEAILCQDRQSLQLAEQLLSSPTAMLSGDTRFDQVAALSQEITPLQAVEDFVDGRFCLVIGSSWPEETELISRYLVEQQNDEFCVIIAPHKPQKSAIETLKKSIAEPSVLWSELNTATRCKVLIIDTIGLLNRVYQSADVAFVGGGFRTGLHNTLEPAALGIPVLIGPKYETFPEVHALVELGGVLVINDFESLETTLTNFIKQPELQAQLGQINRQFVSKNKGATAKVLETIAGYIH